MIRLKVNSRNGDDEEKHYQEHKAPRNVAPGGFVRGERTESGMEKGAV